MGCIYRTAGVWIPTEPTLRRVQTRTSTRDPDQVSSFFERSGSGLQFFREIRIWLAYFLRDPDQGCRFSSDPDQVCSFLRDTDQDSSFFERSGSCLQIFRAIRIRCSDFSRDPDQVCRVFERSGSGLQIFREILGQILHMKTCLAASYLLLLFVFSI